MPFQRCRCHLGRRRCGWLCGLRVGVSCLLMVGEVQSGVEEERGVKWEGWVCWIPVDVFRILDSIVPFHRDTPAWV